MIHIPSINKQSPQQQASNYFNEFAAASNDRILQNYMFSPMILNTALKSVNMNTADLSLEQLEQIMMQPHENEQTLRKFAMHLYNTATIFKRMCHMWADTLTFDFYPKPYKEDGSSITLEEMSSQEFKEDYQEMVKFFNMFNAKKEFNKVALQCVIFDAYYTSLREYNNKLYLQELPSDYCMIDAESVYGYLFSFDLSYFMNGGVSISGYSQQLRSAYSEALKNNNSTNEYKLGLPNKRNGKWVQWTQMSPDDAWVFKFHNGFPASVPPMVGEFSDYAKIPSNKKLQDTINELQAYKVIFGTVPRLKDNKGGNKSDDFAISSTELGKFVASVKESLKTDFKAAPLEDFKSFSFEKASNTKTITEDEFKNLLLQCGASDAALSPNSFNMASSAIYKAVSSNFVTNAIYPQCSEFCEYQVNKRTKKYKFKIPFEGTIFDKDDRSKQADTMMTNGIITPKIFADKGLDITTIGNEINLMESLGFPYGGMMKPILTANTGSNNDKMMSGRPQKDTDELSDSGAQTQDTGANIDKVVK